MKPNSLRNLLTFLSLYLIASFAGPCLAEQGVVLVQVENTKRQPVRGVEIGIEGFGDSKLTNDAGKARLAVGGKTKVGEWLSVFIAHSLVKKDFVIVSPWDNRAQVPSFDDRPENFIKVVVVERGERAALEDGTVLAAFATKINKANALMSEHGRNTPLDPAAKLTEVARQYGLEPDELDRAIRSWGAKSTDPYEVGLAALYERNYLQASENLAASLHQRYEKYATDRRAFLHDPEELADAAFFLGSSLYQQGKYQQAAQALNSV